ncbi:hypothetical protein [Gemmata massiliana]|uniref:hypothetical protein n=1 Tax=Gemmata massiliana TaxID=1210884 RepID=UPI0013A6B10C|nr:hypothetical protein [Gemmata massiliana]
MPSNRVATRRPKKPRAGPPADQGLTAALRAAADRPGCDPRIRAWLGRLLSGESAGAEGPARSNKT